MIREMASVKRVRADIVKCMGSDPICLDYTGRLFLLPFPFGETKTEVTRLYTVFIRDTETSKDFLAKNSVCDGGGL